MVLAGLFAEVLRLERIGVSDNFFGLGGNSLTAVKLIARVLAEFGVRLPLWVVFQFGSVSELAKQLDRRFEAAQSGRRDMN